MHLVMSLLLLTLTAACTQPLPAIPKVTADFRFSNATGLGIQNAGFLDLGTMYVWDLSHNVLHPIGVAGLDVAPKRPKFCLALRHQQVCRGLRCPVYQ